MQKGAVEDLVLVVDRRDMDGIGLGMQRILKPTQDVLGICVVVADGMQ